MFTPFRKYNSDCIHCICMFIVTYEIRITTGDIPNAGTDSRITLTLIGDQPDSPDFHIDNPHKDDFERGQ